MFCFSGTPNVFHTKGDICFRYFLGLSNTAKPRRVVCNARSVEVLSYFKMLPCLSVSAIDVSVCSWVQRIGVQLGIGLRCLFEVLCHR